MNLFQSQRCIIYIQNGVKIWGFLVNKGLLRNTIFTERFMLFDGGIKMFENIRENIFQI